MGCVVVRDAGGRGIADQQHTKVVFYQLKGVVYFFFVFFYFSTVGRGVGFTNDKEYSTSLKRAGPSIVASVK